MLTPTPLPDEAYITDEIDGEVYRMRRGFAGFELVETDRTAEELNLEAGVTPAHVSAMLAGMIQGWTAIDADPDLYDQDGSRRSLN